jgi:hypothetical protein
MVSNNIFMLITQDFATVRLNWGCHSVIHVNPYWIVLLGCVHYFLVDNLNIIFVVPQMNGYNQWCLFDLECWFELTDLSCDVVPKHTTYYKVFYIWEKSEFETANCWTSVSTLQTDWHIACYCIVLLNVCSSLATRLLRRQTQNMMGKLIKKNGGI